MLSLSLSGRLIAKDHDVYNGGKSGNLPITDCTAGDATSGTPHQGQWLFSQVRLPLYHYMFTYS